MKCNGPGGPPGATILCPNIGSKAKPSNGDQYLCSQCEERRFCFQNDHKVFASSAKYPPWPAKIIRANTDGNLFHVEF